MVRVGHKPKLEPSMSLPLDHHPQFQEFYIQHLIRQWDHLTVVRSYHLWWMTRAGDPQISERHRNMAELLERTLSEYEDLLAALQSQ